MMRKRHCNKIILIHNHEAQRENTENGVNLLKPQCSPPVTHLLQHSNAYLSFLRSSMETYEPVKAILIQFSGLDTLTAIS